MREEVTAARIIRAVRNLLLVGVLAALTLSAAPAIAATADQVGAWGPVIGFGVPGTHMVLMHTGEVLYWRDGNEARVFDPASGDIASTPSPFPQAFSFHCGAHVVLADGRVLAIGGGADPHVGHSATGIFDPLTRRWTRTADLNSPRWYATATTLADGRVLLVGGEDSGGADVNSVEVYDPAADSWTLLKGADHNQDLYSSNYLLPDGRIYDAAPRPATALLDLGTRSWSRGPVSAWKTNGYSESGAMYLPAKIIRSGGTTSDLAATDTASNRTGVIDMTAPAPAWQETSPMAFPRRRHNMVILSDGQVMAVGGTRQGDDPQQAVLAGEIWNPQSRRWATVASMAQPRMYHSAALLLPDGRVLTAGGETATAGPDTPKTAQIYSPPYLFKGSRPTITGAPASVGYGGSFSIGTPDAASITKVALIRPGAVTHALNMEQRYVPLSFTQAGDGLTINSPTNGNWAPPGWYMLVIENAGGVPSVSRWIQLGDGFPVEGGPVGLPLPDAPADPGSASGSGSGPDPGGPREPGAGTSGGGDHRPGLQPRRPGASLRLSPRIRVRGLRVHGLRMVIRVDVPLTAARPVMRLRLRRVITRTSRRLIATAFRISRRRGTFGITLRSPALRRLRPGRYEVELAVGNSRSSLRPPAARRFTLIR